MSAPSDPHVDLAQTPVNRQVIEQLYQQSVIDADGKKFALQQAYPKQQWALWIMRLSIGLGTALLLLGVIFFFAYNWHAMPKWSKLALIEGAMVLCFVGAYAVGIQRLVGQYLLLSGTLLIGVFFAVFGQIYQTGADAWQLFALWALLMLGFVGLSRFPAQWLLQWVITFVALSLFIHQNNIISERWFAVILLWYTLSIYILQQVLGKHRWQWLSVRWLQLLSLVLVHIVAVFAVTVALFANSLQLPQVILCATAVIALLLWHRRLRDWSAQIIGTATLAVCLWLAVLRLVFENFTLWGDLTVPISVMLVVTIGLSVGLFQLITKMKKTQDNRSEVHYDES